MSCQLAYVSKGSKNDSRTVRDMKGFYDFETTSGHVMVDKEWSTHIDKSHTETHTQSQENILI